MKLKSKGTLGYINNRKLARILLFLGEVLLIIAIFLTGYFSTGSRENLLTVVAIVGVLPAAKALVGVIMILPYRSQTQDAYDEICAVADNRCIVLTELVLTTAEKIMPIDFIVVRENHIVGYTTNPKCDINFTDRFLADNMQLNGYKVSVKIMTDKKKFLARVSELASKEINEEQYGRDTEIATTVLTLAL